MFIIKYCGGLGNQMYQYAFQIVMKKLYPEQKIKADISHYFLLKEHNGYELGKWFNVDIDVATPNEISDIACVFVPNKRIAKLPYRLRFSLAHKATYIRQIKGIFSKKKKANYISGYCANIYNDVVMCLNKKGNYYFDGLWQNIEYFKNYEDEIISAFHFKCAIPEKDVPLMEQIMNTNSVSVHIRCGDFKNTMFDICDYDYYLQAMKIMEEREQNIQYFIFSDDSEYANVLFRDIKNKVIVRHSSEEGGVDMQLISLCKHNIIANSTFSFWGAFLNRNSEKTVIAPLYAFINSQGAYKFSVPSEWIQIKNGSM